MKKLTTEEFIKKANIIHDDTYNYSLVEYVGSFENVKIICKKHGEFEQSPDNHLRRRGCPKCGVEKRILKTNSNIFEFIQKAKNIHGDKYDYSFAIYKNNYTKIKIICPYHGVFEQTPNHHLRGQTCKMCSGLDTICAIKKHVKMLSDIGVEARLNNDNLEVKCYNCDKWHIQSLKKSLKKINAANGKRSGECNLYCSDECKNNCPVFNHKSKSIDPRSKLFIDKTEQELTRLCQNNILKQIQCDEKGYNYCEKCGDIIDVELHHTHEVSKYGVGSINSSGHILLCAGCHTELHSDCKN